MRFACTVIVALLTSACSASPTPIDVAGIYSLISIDGASLPINGTTSGELRIGFTNTFEVELCGSDGACIIIFEGSYSRTGDRLRLEGADAVTEATAQGTRLTMELDGVAYVFERYMPGD